MASKTQESSSALLLQDGHGHDDPPVMKPAVGGGTHDVGAAADGTALKASSMAAMGKPIGSFLGRLAAVALRQNRDAADKWWRREKEILDNAVTHFVDICEVEAGFGLSKAAISFDCAFLMRVPGCPWRTSKRDLLEWGDDMPESAFFYAVNGLEAGRPRRVQLCEVFAQLFPKFVRRVRQLGFESVQVSGLEVCRGKQDFDVRQSPLGVVVTWPKPPSDGTAYSGLSPAVAVSVGACAAVTGAVAAAAVTLCDDAMGCLPLDDDGAADERIPPGRCLVGSDDKTNCTGNGGSTAMASATAEGGGGDVPASFVVFSRKKASKMSAGRGRHTSPALTRPLSNTADERHEASVSGRHGASEDDELLPVSELRSC
eukprot:TRINITY_DN75272_c0_g1_i1.p1 TRINITY_DN75272_c0_g1~~TRINITY_DN75272_c0_g1_i1.p1  ORF type:complete len:372 (-),score=53.34 TRINITY_DN75272_c0_g1_i1:89-1204(-)